MVRRKVCFFAPFFRSFFFPFFFFLPTRITRFWSVWNGSIENKILLKQVIAAPVVRTTCVYFNRQLSLNKYADLLFLAEQKVTAVCTGVSPVPRAACWRCRGGTVRGVVCLKHFITAPHQPSLRLAAYRFSMKGPVHTCGNSNYL